MRTAGKGGEARFWGPGQWGVTPRLLVLVLVPLLGLMTFAVPAAASQLADAGRAERLEAQVDRLARVLTLRFALHAERVPTEAAMRATEVGVALETAGDLLGFDIAPRRTETEAATDAALADLGDASPIAAATLADMRTVAARNTIKADDYVDLVAAQDALLVRVSQEALAGIAENNVPGAASDQLDEVLTALRWVIPVIEATEAQLNLVTATMLGTTEQGTGKIELAASAARLHLAVDQIHDIELPSIAGRWDALTSKPAMSRFRATVDRAAQGSVVTMREAPSDALVKLSDFSRDGIEVDGDLYQFARDANDVLRQTAATLRADTQSSLRWTVAFAFALIVVTIGVSWAFARSISRPLRRLADRASAVSAGDLRAGADASHGPRDIVVAGEALDDLVANLSLLESKAQALAACDFDAPVLSETVPGPLGESIQESVRVLSGSMAERDALQERVLHQATHDDLTGVHNRASAAEFLDSALARARRTRSGLAVLTIDLDGFQRVNDRFGFAVGDEVLREIARRVTDVVRSGDLVARIESDELVVVTEVVNDVDDAHVLARRLLAAIAEPVTVASDTILPSACVGIALTADGDNTVEQMLTSAGLAVHRAKTRGAGNVEVFDTELQKLLNERADIEDALTAAMSADDELFLHYQPVIDLNTDRLVGVEALIRWQRGDRGMQPPDSFIPVAESSGLIVDVDNWVFQRVARQMHEWQNRPTLSDVDVAVNVSGRHLFGHDLARDLDRLVDESPIDPQRMILEVTETVLLDDLAVAASQLGAVRDRGFRVAIDDFGTGYTSITHLQQLPADILKLDRSFVDRATNERDRVLLAMMADVGHHLGLTITGEGVETTEQLDVLRELGCDHAQGYHLGRPQTPQALDGWIAEHAPSI